MTIPVEVLSHWITIVVPILLGLVFFERRLAKVEGQLETIMTFCHQCGADSETERVRVRKREKEMDGYE